MKTLTGRCVFHPDVNKQFIIDFIDLHGNRAVAVYVHDNYPPLSGSAKEGGTGANGLGYILVEDYWCVNGVIADVPISSNTKTYCHYYIGHVADSI